MRQESDELRRSGREMVTGVCAAARSAGSRVGDRVSDMNVYAGMRAVTARVGCAAAHLHRMLYHTTTAQHADAHVTHTPHGMCVTTRRSSHTIVDGLVADVAFLAF
jgi:hypothetical protein